MTYDGVRDLESDFSTIDFLLYAPPVDNTGQLTVQFNGQPGPYPVGLTAEAPVADIALSLYPSENDRGNPDETTYSVNIQAQQEKDAQISKLLALTPTFADLRAPRAIVTAPYDGQRVSPMVFDANNPFDIEAFSEDTDLTKIQIQIRSKKTDGVWGPWENLSGMVWEDGGSNNNATVFDRLDRDPIRREFTFNWPVDRGVGEYQIRAQASDNALRAGQPDFPGNVDLDPPVVNLIVDASAPTVLTTIPDYQAPESDRTYRGELSAIFTDDMQADSIGSDSFVVTDLLKNSEKVPGFISYSPALRKTLFVPVVPFKPNGFYRVEVRTDTQVDDGQGGTTTLPGARDLAGNVLDNTFSWTFRTTDGAFEETWSIELSVTDSSVGGSVGADTNNIAAVAFGAADGEEEKDARAAPSIGGQLHLSFLDVDAVEFDRDTRPADGRLSHHWFFVVDNAQGTVTLRWKPSARLVQDPSLRQYKVVKLFEFVDSGGTLTPQEIAIPDPNTARDPSTQLPAEVDLYTYIPNTGETSRYFRIDVQKASFIATDFQKGTSGWKFFSVPIDPDEAEPFVGLGDDIDPFQLYQYDTALQGYKIYPLDLGEVGLVTGRGYFTRLNQDVEIDIGGTNNAADMPVSLDTIGWHAIGNPFLLPVQVSTLEVSDGNSTNSFSDAVTAGWIQGTLYRWSVGATQFTAATTQLSDAALDAQIIPPELKTAFNTQLGIDVSTASVVVVEPRSRWEIHHTTGIYLVTFTTGGGSPSTLEVALPDAYAPMTLSDALEPWDGCWLKTEVGNLTLTMPVPAGIGAVPNPLPISLSTPPMAPPASGASVASGVNRERTQVGSRFSLKLMLTSGGSSDVTTAFGTHPAAQVGPDALDASEPPTLGGTVALYFEHVDWGDQRGLYNTDYQPSLDVGESRTWQLTAFTDKRDTTMRLSWENALAQLPEDTMFYFRRLDQPTPQQSEIRNPQSTIEWQDMRKVSMLELEANTRITKISFEIRAQRFAMAPLTEVQLIPGEKQVEIRWKAEDNPFIDNYLIERRDAAGRVQSLIVNRQSSIVNLHRH